MELKLPKLQIPLKTNRLFPNLEIKFKKNFVVYKKDFQQKSLIIVSK